MTTTTETITPELARQYLSAGAKNRIVKQDRVKEFVRDLKRGDFYHSHQGIAFDTHGRLFDGQHRLLAIAMTGIPAVMQVSRDCTDEDVFVTDRGASRSIADCMRINSAYDGSPMAQLLSDNRLVSAVTSLTNCNYFKGNNALGVNDVRLTAESFSNSLSLVYDNIIKRYGSRIKAPMAAAAIAAVECGVDVDTITRFFCVFAKDDVTGCEEYNVSAVLNWKRQLDNARARHVRVEQRKLYMGTQNAIFHFVNNTKVTTIAIPSKYRYDVSEKVKAAVEAGFSDCA